MEQVPGFHKRDWTWIATLAAEPTAIGQRYGFQFEDSNDDLGSFKVVIVRLSTGRLVMLMKRENPYLTGTTMLAEQPSDLGSYLYDALRDLELQTDEVLEMVPVNER